jgi:hypothetical protein
MNPNEIFRAIKIFLELPQNRFSSTKNEKIIQKTYKILKTFQSMSKHVFYTLLGENMSCNNHECNIN